VIIIANFGGPGTINLMSEIELIIISCTTRKAFLVGVSIICALSLSYNLILYASVHQGIRRSGPSTPVKIREMLLLWRCIIPNLLILLGVEYF